MYVTHRSGHGIDITVHESPILSFTDDTVIEKGMCFSAKLDVYYLMGSMVYASVNFGLNSISDKGVIFFISVALDSVIVALAKKFPNQKWIGVKYI